MVYLYLSDGLSGIDYDSLQAVSLTGEPVTPVSVEPQSGCVTFSNLEATINVYVSDLAGNRLQLILSLTDSKRQESNVYANMPAWPADRRSQDPAEKKEEKCHEKI